MKIAVEVGLVVGTIPANQADRFGDGDGTESVIFRQDATGFFIFIGVVDILEAKWFLITLSSTIPIPDSSTAIFGQRIRASAAARAAAREDLSTCS